MLFARGGKESFNHLVVLEVPDYVLSGSSVNAVDSFTPIVERKFSIPNLPDADTDADCPGLGRRPVLRLSPC